LSQLLKVHPGAPAAALDLMLWDWEEPTAFFYDDDWPGRRNP